jgi:hypothetical protein
LWAFLPFQASQVSCDLLLAFKFHQLALGRMKQEDLEFKARVDSIMDYITNENTSSYSDCVPLTQKFCYCNAQLFLYLKPLVPREVKYLIRLKII